MGIGGNSRGLYTLEVYEGKNKLEATLSDGNTLHLNVSVYGAENESHHVLGRRLMAKLWYDFGMRKRLTTAAEWKFFQAYWELECERRLQASVTHPSELVWEIFMEYGILYPASGEMKLMPPREGTVRIGTDLPNLLPDHLLRQHYASQPSC